MPKTWSAPHVFVYISEVGKGVYDVEPVTTTELQQIPAVKTSQKDCRFC